MNSFLAAVLLSKRVHHLTSSAIFDLEQMLGDLKNGLFVVVPLLHEIFKKLTIFQTFNDLIRGLVPSTPEAQKKRLLLFIA